MRKVLVLLVLALVAGCSAKDDPGATPATDRPTTVVTGTTTTIEPVRSAASDALVRAMFVRSRDSQFARAGAVPPRCDDPGEDLWSRVDVTGGEDGSVLWCVGVDDGQRVVRIVNDQVVPVLVRFPRPWMASPAAVLPNPLASLARRVEGFDGDRRGRVLPVGGSVEFGVPVDVLGQAIVTVPTFLWGYGSVELAVRVLDDLLGSRIGTEGRAGQIIEEAGAAADPSVGGFAECLADDPPLIWDGVEPSAEAEQDSGIVATSIMSWALACGWSVTGDWVAAHAADRVVALDRAASTVAAAVDDLDRLLGRRPGLVWEPRARDFVVEAGEPGGPNWNDIDDATIPSVCGHPPTTLVDGVHREVPPADGFLELQRWLNSGGPGLVMGLPSDRGPLTVVAAACSGGGVSYPTNLVFFSAGGNYFGETHLVEADWRSLDIVDVGRGGVRSMTVEGDLLKVDLLLYRWMDGGCCPRGTGTAWVRAKGGRLVIDRIERGPDKEE